MALWELSAEDSISKSLSRRTTYPKSAGAYGKVYKYDLAPPKRVISLTGSGMTSTDYNYFVGQVKARNSVTGVTDSIGRSWSGRVVSVSAPVLNGTVYFSFTIQMEIEDDDS